MGKLARTGSGTAVGMSKQDLLAGVSTSAAALALSLVPNAARAQAVNGTPTVVFGSDAVSNNPNSSLFNITANEALIDWSVNNATFLPNGTTLTFQRDVSQPYTVLNRVISSVTPAGVAITSPLAIDGAINADSYGKVWFYNPNGWVANSTARINVGSLLLTSSPITIDPAAPGDPSRFLGPNGEIRLGQTPNPASSVIIQPGAIASSLADNSYIALVAPRVIQAGAVVVNGSAAYVGAEAATLTINNGLFDITVDSGTTDANGVGHTGVTTGTASTANSPSHGIYMVAVPKNQAMTMVVAGTVGYVAANVAAAETDGTITLGAGYNVTNGTVDFANPVTGLGTNSASILMVQLNAVNDLTAYASNVAAVTASGNTTALRNTALNARNGVLIAVGPATANGTNSSLSVNGNLTLTANQLRPAARSPSMSATPVPGACRSPATSRPTPMALAQCRWIRIPAVC
jgi:filamentous hemagglutinin family protein